MSDYKKVTIAKLVNGEWVKEEGMKNIKIGDHFEILDDDSRKGVVYEATSEPYLIDTDEHGKVLGVDTTPITQSYPIDEQEHHESY